LGKERWIGARLMKLNPAIDGYIMIYTAWWFGTFFIFPYIGNNNPN